MLQALRQPKWIVAAVVIALLAGVFVRLGLWQLDRLEERRNTNAVGEERLSMEPVELDVLLDEIEDLDEIEYRRATVAGRFETEDEVLIRSQVELGQAGFHVVTPLVTGGGKAVLVNRGWVPITMDTPPVEAAPDPGRVVVEGWVHLTETRPALGQEEPQGDLEVLNRVDIDRIQQQTDYELAPVYLVAMGERDEDLPVRLDPPDFGDEGPHLAYAIQWFGFAAVAVVGFYFLLRRKGGEATLV